MKSKIIIGLTTFSALLLLSGCQLVKEGATSESSTTESSVKTISSSEKESNADAYTKAVEHANNVKVNAEKFAVKGTISTKIQQGHDVAITVKHNLPEGVGLTLKLSGKMVKGAKETVEKYVNITTNGTGEDEALFKIIPDGKFTITATPTISPYSEDSLIKQFGADGKNITGGISEGTATVATDD